MFKISNYKYFWSYKTVKNQYVENNSAKILQKCFRGKELLNDKNKYLLCKDYIIVKIIFNLWKFDKLKALFIYLIFFSKINKYFRATKICYWSEKFLINIKIFTSIKIDLHLL